MYQYNNRRKYIPSGTITRKSLETAVVTLPKNSYTYTGEAISPLPTVRLDGVLLAVNEDYTVAYVNNTDLGLATVAVTGIDKYYGTAAAEFYITSSASGGWANFDLSLLGDPVASASLRDSTAYYYSNTNLSGLGIQTLPDDSIFFIAPEQGHAYIWGFDDGHAFEVGHFKSTYTSRSRSVSNYKGGTLGNSGTLLYDYNSSEGTCKTILDTAYQLSTENSRSHLVVSMGIEPMRMQFSYDGRKLFYRGGNEATTLYYTDLSTPWDLASKGNHSYIDLSSLSNLPFDSMVEALAFLLSPDGKTLLFTCSGTASQVKKQFLIKLSLSTAYDLTTASVHSYKQLTTGSNWWQGVAVNSAATKMLLHLWNSTTRVFYEYDLTASA